MEAAVLRDCECARDPEWGASAFPLGISDAGYGNEKAPRLGRCAEWGPVPAGIDGACVKAIC